MVSRNSAGLGEPTCVVTPAGGRVCTEGSPATVAPVTTIGTCNSDPCSNPNNLPNCAIMSKRPCYQTTTPPGTVTAVCQPRYYKQRFFWQNTHGPVGTDGTNTWWTFVGQNGDSDIYMEDGGADYAQMTPAGALNHKSAMRPTCSPGDVTAQTTTTSTTTGSGTPAPVVTNPSQVAVDPNAALPAPMQYVGPPATPSSFSSFFNSVPTWAWVAGAGLVLFTFMGDRR